MVLRRALCDSVLVAVVALPAAAEPPRGSITIERIADIKYPTIPPGRPMERRSRFGRATTHDQ